MEDKGDICPICGLYLYQPDGKFNELECHCKEKGQHWYLFHMTRINNILLGQQTPMNDYNNGLSEDGNFIVPLYDHERVVSEILMSLVEMKYLSIEQYHVMTKRMRETE